MTMRSKLDGLLTSAALLVVSGALSAACSSDDGADPGTQGGAGGSSGSAGSGGSWPGNGGSSGASGNCSAPIAGSALVFDGVDDHVTMGAAEELGLAELTVEAWVRRDGVGQSAGTGVGGLQLVPIAGKGRGESDGTNVDCNYQFGFFGDVLGADFEDMESGANHPITGKTAIPKGEWHHVAATYDGTTWRLFVDGKLDAEKDANAIPRNDSIQHFGIGAAFDSTGASAGRLHGALDEVRVWSHARSEAEIAASMYQTLESASGLVGRWALDQGQTSAEDSTGNNPGTVEGAVFASPGAVLDQGAPPLIVTPAPADQASVSADSVKLGVSVNDPDSGDLLITFHAREVTEADDFTIAVLPDTQYYTVTGNGFQQYFYDQTQWIMDNREAYNIVAAIHNGDIVDHGDDFDAEWKVADKAMKTLEQSSSELPDGLPYALAVGNHDLEPINTTGSTKKFNEYFGVARFQGRAYYGGHYGSKNDESWITFNASGIDFLVLNMQFDSTPDPAVLSWAKSVFDSHPNTFGVVNSHYILGSTGKFGTQGQAIYDTMKAVDHVQLMTCGHITGESKRSDEFEGNVIHSMLADFQFRDKDTPAWRGGEGWMRIWEFSPAAGELTVRTYSPSLDEWETDANSEFTLPVDLRGAGGNFDTIAELEQSGGSASATLNDLKPGSSYEWYVTVTDCAHTVSSPVYRFTTPP